MNNQRLAFTLLLATCSGACTSSGGPAATQLETLVPGSALHAPNGITFGPDGYLYAGSVGAQTVFRIDVSNGAVEVVVPAPAGEADDVAFAPDGTLVWTALVAGEIRALQADGTVTTVVSDYALINPVDFTADGRLFAAQIGFDRLHEFPVDEHLVLNGEPRLVASKIGNLNSFEITADNNMYGPLVNKGEVARIDIETGEVTSIAGGLGTVVAVNLDAAGNIWAIDWVSGDLWRIAQNKDNSWQAPQRIATLQPPLDNLAIGPDGMVYISRPAHSGIDRVDPATGQHTVLIEGHLAAPGGMAITTLDGRETLLVADGYGYRVVDTASGTVTSTFDITTFGFPGVSTAAAANDDYFALTDVVVRPSVYLVDRKTGKTVTKWRDIKSALGIVLTAAGDPLITDYSSGTLVQLNRTNRKLRDVIATDLAGPVGLTWANANQDAVYVAESLTGRITRIDIDIARDIARQQTRTPIVSGLAQPEGITLMSDGRIAVVEVGRQRLLAVDPANGAVEVLATGLPVGHAAANAPGPVHRPSGVAQGTDGTLYISGDLDNSIRMLRD
jgi:sugar lactone lactonase YvrE